VQIAKCREQNEDRKLRRRASRLISLHSALCTHHSALTFPAGVALIKVLKLLQNDTKLASRDGIKFAPMRNPFAFSQSADPVCEIARRHRRRPLFGYSSAAINPPDRKTRARATRSDNLRQNRRDRPAELNRSNEKRRVQKFERHLCADERRL
jgi:hypothetical protein